MTARPKQPLPVPADRSAPIAFGGNGLDRVADRRSDAAFLQSLRRAPDVRVILLADDRALFAAHTPQALSFHFTRAQAEALGVDLAEAIFLGLERAPDGRSWPVFAALAANPPETDREAAGHSAIDLRSVANQGLLSGHDLGVLAQARSLTGWHARHRFCANCGAPTAMAQAGYRRDCPSCGANHFPRVDPVVIMLTVDRERDRCLLGRQHRFQPGMFSCLAGFLEPGETLEDAVRREVHEEAGIVTGTVVYHASQPWPFPSSLMIGCFAQALSREILIEEAELEDARWFERHEIAAMLERTHAGGLFAPPPMAIAHVLMRAYLDADVPWPAGRD